MIDCVFLAAQVEREGGGGAEDVEEVAGQGRWGRGGQEGREHVQEVGVEGGEGGVEVWGQGGRGAEEGGDLVRADPLAEEAWSGAPQRWGGSVLSIRFSIQSRGATVRGYWGWEGEGYYIPSSSINFKSIALKPAS